MKRLRRAALLISVLIPGQAVAQSNTPALLTRPDVFVSGLYQQVVARHPIGLPDMKIFAPYLSKALLHRIDLSIACLKDQVGPRPDPNVKPASVLIENGLFSGASEQATPKNFRIDRTESGKDGSFRVYVRLHWEEPGAIIPLDWSVVVVVVPENGRFAVDDVIYLKDKERSVESRLSEHLSYGCNGARWVGVPPRSR